MILDSVATVSKALDHCQIFSHSIVFLGHIGEKLTVAKRRYLRLYDILS